jgi:cytochrome P450
MGMPADQAAFERDFEHARTTIGRLVRLVREAYQDQRRPMTPTAELIVNGTEEGRLSDGQLFSFIFALLVAGHETTGNTLAWLIYHLCREPRLLARVTGEIARFYRRAPERVLTSNDYFERPWTQAVLYEVLRRRPLIVSIARTALDDGEMAPDPESGIGAFRYCKNTVFIASIPGVHRDPSRYDDPLAFRPERWMEGVTDEMELEAQGRRVWDNARRRERGFDLIPFSEGPARCLGQDFNMLEVFHVLDMLLRRCELDLFDPDRPVPESKAAISGPCDGTLLVRLRRAPG